MQSLGQPRPDGPGACLSVPIADPRGRRRPPDRIDLGGRQPAVDSEEHLVAEESKQVEASHLLEGALPEARALGQQPRRATERLEGGVRPVGEPGLGSHQQARVSKPKDEPRQRAVEERVGVLAAAQPAREQLVAPAEEHQEQPDRREGRGHVCPAAQHVRLKRGLEVAQRESEGMGGADGVQDRREHARHRGEAAEHPGEDAPPRANEQCLCAAVQSEERLERRRAAAAGL
mmetsp:Transcript_47133/g.151936  ORF Transcript_47133/g.151936 Transcript_47133/m.151936 type:complete len:232 (+) Transcript_47133:161-856(+)